MKPILTGIVYTVVLSLGIFPLALQLSALAQPTIYSVGTLPGWNGDYITGVSDAGTSNILGSTMTVGETFRIDNGDALVTSIAFPLQTSPPQAADAGPLNFQVGVAAWNGVQPTGPLLYLSGQLVGLDNAWQNYLLTPSNLVLNQGQQYVLFFTGINYLDGLESESALGYLSGNPYPDGQIFFLGYGGTSVTFNDLFVHGWTTEVGDLAFQIDYQTIPEPGVIVLLGFGSVFLIMRYKFGHAK
jgi:hypothetical protein